MMPAAAPSGGDLRSAARARSSSALTSQGGRARRRERARLAEAERRDELRRWRRPRAGAGAAGVAARVLLAVVLGQREHGEEVAARGAHAQQRAVHFEQRVGVGRAAAGLRSASRSPRCTRTPTPFDQLLE